MRGRFRAFFVALVVGSLVSADPFGAIAAGGSVSAPQSHVAASSAESTLARIQQQLADRRRALAQTRMQEQHALVQLSWAQERLERARMGLAQTVSALHGTQAAVAQVTSSLATVSQQLETHETLMGARVRAFYERGPLGYLDVLLGAADFRDFVSRSYLLGVIINRDVQLYQQVSSERAKQSEARATLAEQEQHLAEQQAQWIVSRDQTVRLAQERRDLLTRVRSQRLAQEEAIRELEAESLKITDIIRRSTGRVHVGPIPTLRDGALLWPVEGRISSGYGWRTHPIFGTREFHTGIDIAVPWGTPIHAAAPGSVIFTGWMRGYGMLVILDHGNGLSTTYSHLSSYSVHVGQRVERGEVIAHIGSTGWSTGPHLFFEVREDGKPVNPLGE
ncbi:MAG TPA: peptidoglycan DD-metalloendopeptidase family protein [bacterium]|nr:peptidoglycan DD-metalloendopeptidase family protein [bacterium]